MSDPIPPGLPELGFDSETPRRRLLLRAVAVLAVLLLIAVLVLVGMRALSAKLPPADFQTVPPASAPLVPVQVRPGDSLAVIGSTLAAAGVVSSPGVFVGAAAAEPAARHVQPGRYRLPRQLPAQVALDALLGRGTFAVTQVDVPAGFTAEQVLDRLSARTRLTSQQLSAAVKKPARLGLPTAANGHLEGWLAPGRYDVTASDTAAGVLTRMVTAQRQEVSAAGLPSAAKQQHRNVEDLMTVASIVEKEGVEDDFGKIARVIDNRLRGSMRLQMDSTVNYARKTSTLQLDGSALSDRSPFNTYAHAGLPPAPIGSPSAAALEAAADPAAGPWLYFVLAGKDGHSAFTTTFAEHQQAVAKARRAGLF